LLFQTGKHIVALTYRCWRDLVRALITAVVALIVSAPMAGGQFPPERATNLQVLPKSISMDSLVSVMGAFTRALGVRCSHCHVQKEGQPFEQMDFSLDDNPTKQKARAMLRMVAAINADHLARLDNRRQPEIRVTCATCHRGLVEPRPLQQVLLNAYIAAGADSTEAAYRALRDRYYGSGSYNFGEVTLSDLAESIASRGQLKDAIRFHTLNAAVNPGSTFALRQLAQSHLADRDTASAITAYERALALNASDSQSRRALDALRRRP
jgi:photosynthetic reaction center cytochrome c subunit